MHLFSRIFLGSTITDLNSKYSDAFRREGEDVYHLRVHWIKQKLLKMAKRGRLIELSSILKSEIPNAQFVVVMYV